MAEAVCLDLSHWIAIRRLWAKGYAGSNPGRRSQIERPRASRCAGGGVTRRRALFRGGVAQGSPEFVESGVPGRVLACGLTWEVVRIMRNPLGVEPGLGRPWDAAAMAGVVLGHGTRGGVACSGLGCSLWSKTTSAK